MLMFVALTAPAGAAPVLAPVGSFDRPMYVTAPLGDEHRVFVAERSGTIRVVKDGVVLPNPFLDVSTRLDGMRTGLASFAFAPDYATSGRMYVLYSGPPSSGSSGVDVVLDEFTRSADDPDRADPPSRRNVWTLDFAGTVDHDADHIEFGPDGLLYMTVGEGANQRDRSQDPHQPRASCSASTLGPRRPPRTASRPRTRTRTASAGCPRCSPTACGTRGASRSITTAGP